jgi:hypothetical protein
MILYRLPNAVIEYATSWGNQLIRAIELNFNNVKSEFDTTYRYTSNGYNGSFYDTTIQTIAAINTAYAMTYDTTVLSNGITIESSSHIKFTYSGVYNIQFSAQIDNTASPAAIVWIWLRKNGTSDVAYSATKVHVQGSNAYLVAAWNFVDTFTAGDYVEIMWSSDKTSVRLLSEIASSPVPAIPSVILTVVQEARV